MLVKEININQPIFILEIVGYDITVKEYLNSKLIPKEYLEKEIRDMTIEEDGVEIWV